MTVYNSCPETIAIFAPLAVASVSGPAIAQVAEATELWQSLAVG